MGKYNERLGFIGSDDGENSAHDFDTTKDYSVSGGKIASWKNAGTEVSSLLHDGSFKARVLDKGGGAYNVETYGADPSASGSTNTTAIQAAIDAAETAGGGTVAILQPGTYDLDEAGVNPYDNNNRYCLDIGADDITLLLGPGVTLQLADGQQTDANGAVDMIVFKDLTGVSIVGAGPGASRITGNTSGQTGWSGGYAQQDNGNIISGYASTGNGCHDVIVQGLTLDDHWSNPVVIDWDGSTIGLNTRCNFRDLHCVDVGEGPLILGGNNISFNGLVVDDASDVAVGDGIEFANCSDVRLINYLVKNNGSGSAVDLFGTHGCQISNFIIDGHKIGIDFGETGAGRITKDVVVENGIIKNITSAGGALLISDGEDHGDVSIQNVLVHDCADRGFQLRGEPTDGVITFTSCVFRDCGTNPDIGKGRIRFYGCRFDNNGTGVALNRVDAVTPDVEFHNCEFVNNTRGIHVSGGGTAWHPDGVIRGASFENNSTADIDPISSGTLNNFDLDASVRLANADRPTAGIAGRVFFNTTDGNLNIDTGSGWITPDGTAT